LAVCIPDGEYDEQAVDFVSGNEVAVEVKAKSLMSPRDLKGLHALSEDLTLSGKVLVCTEQEPRRLKGNIDVFPVKTSGLT